jgi:hypothetical protein
MTDDTVDHPRDGDRNDEVDESPVPDPGAAPGDAADNPEAD